MSDKGAQHPHQRATMPEYEVELRVNSSQLEATIPKDLVRFHEFENGESVSFSPRLQQGEVVYDIDRGKGGWSNERKIKRVNDWACLRFPNEFAVERGLLEGAACDSGVTLHFETHHKKELTLSTSPSMKPVEYADGGKMLEEPYYTTLKKNPNEDSHQLRLDVLQPWSNDGVLSLDGGEKYATRLSSRERELALVLDLEVDPADENNSNVRTFFRHDLSSIEGVDDDYSAIRGAFSKPFAHGMDLARPTDKPVSVKMWPEPNRIVVKRIYPSRINWFRRKLG